MREISNDDIKKIEFDGLLRIKEFCNHNNLTYYLGFGTLLGAVRHKGFIPWDDDIDLFMPLQSYAKFVQLRDSFNNEEWELNNYRSNPRYLFPWTKVSHKKTKLLPSRFSNGFVYGVSIDVFPLFPISCDNDLDVVKLHGEFTGAYESIIKRVKQFRLLSGGKRDTINNIIYPVLYHFITKHKYNLNSEYDKLFDSLPYAFNGTYYMNPFDPYRSVYKRLFFESALTPQGGVLLPFENEYFRVPDDYDAVLTASYGDYMTPPPVEKRVTNHSFKAYRI